MADENPNKIDGNELGEVFQESREQMLSKGASENAKIVGDLQREQATTNNALKTANPQNPAESTEKSGLMQKSKNFINRVRSQTAADNKDGSKMSAQDKAKAAKSVNTIAKDAAVGNYVGAAVAALKNFKNIKQLLKERASLKKKNALPALAAFILVAIVCFSVFGMFVVGIKNMLPGTKGGTTFAQSTTSYDSLTAVRMKSEGDQGTQALMKEIQLNGTSKINTDLNKVASEVESKGTLNGQALTDFKGLVLDTLNELSLLAGMPSTTDEEKAAFTAKAKLVSTNIDKILTTLEEVTLGSPSSKSLYNLPDMTSLYLKKDVSQQQKRQYGRKELIYVIINTAKEFTAKYPDYKLRVGDMSLADGGEIKPYTSHQCGNEAIISVSYKGSNKPSDALNVKSTDFNAQLAKDLADLFLSNGAQQIIFNYPNGDYSKFIKDNNPNNKGIYNNVFDIQISSKTNKYDDCFK